MVNAPLQQNPEDSSNSTAMPTRLELDAIFHPLPSLETERLVLRPIQLAHADALFQVFSDPAVMDPSHEQPHASPSVTANLISSILKKHEDRSGIGWVLVPHGEHAPVGHISIFSICWTHRRAELGFGLLPTLWRRGLMTEALRSVVSFSFDSLGFIKVCAQNTTDNHACHQFLLSAGFQQEGLLRRHGFWNERAHDLRHYGLLARSECPAETCSTSSTS